MANLKCVSMDVCKEGIMRLEYLPLIFNELLNHYRMQPNNMPVN